MCNTTIQWRTALFCNDVALICALHTGRLMFKPVSSIRSHFAASLRPSALTDPNIVSLCTPTPTPYPEIYFGGYFSCLFRPFPYTGHRPTEPVITPSVKLVNASHLNSLKLASTSKCSEDVRRIFSFWWLGRRCGRELLRTFIARRRGRIRQHI